MFNKILVANRGEIACRVIKTARRLGIRTVAVYSEADRNARHVRLADEAILIGPPPARESYLRGEAIIAAAKAAGAQAIHPGYGFLSENEDFAQACLDAGLVFVGPPPSAIRAMGLKAESKRLMAAAGVPLVPGYHGDVQEPDFLLREADAIGYPVLIKASAGGGGKGMRIVERREDFAAALESCRREAAAAFGNTDVLIEKYLERPRHIEIQVFADRHGHVIHLGERDCSVQRRHQKVLEEAPAPGMTSAQRAAMGEAAIAAARAVGYVGAGTVEFIADREGRFYFMEMNTRLQVEHPVTEMITGLDLVEWQLRVAAGEPLPLAQDEIRLSGHAIEARLYAEDPDKGFLPATGRLVRLALPEETIHVRVDSGVEEGDEITPHYDPMIAKLIVWDETRERALARLLAALSECHIVGVANNVTFLSRLAAAPAFVAADLDTNLIPREHDFLFPPSAAAPSNEAWLLCALAELLRDRRYGEQHARDSQDPHSPWHLRDGWRLSGHGRRRIVLRAGSSERSLFADYRRRGFSIEDQGRQIPVDGVLLDDGRLIADLDGRRLSARIVAVGEKRHLFLAGESVVFSAVDPLAPAIESTGAEGSLIAPMPGKVIALLVAPGQEVDKGTPVITLEAMKMEHTLTAPAKGVIQAFHYTVGEQVADGAELADFEPVR